MLTNKTYIKEMQNYTKKLKEEYISSVILVNFDGLEHSMLLGEEKYLEQQENLPFPNLEEYLLLEKVDLMDFEKIYGFNKKRRSLLRRS